MHFIYCACHLIQMDFFCFFPLSFMVIVQIMTHRVPFFAKQVGSKIWLFPNALS